MNVFSTQPTSTPPRIEKYSVNAPWAPKRPTTTNDPPPSQPEAGLDSAKNLAEDFDIAAEETTRYVDSLIFPEIDIDDDQMHYILQEEQLYGNGSIILDMEVDDEDDDVPFYPNPNITLFRGTRQSEEDSDDEIDIVFSHLEQEDEPNYGK
jgi:hypothetical protein